MPSKSSKSESNREIQIPKTWPEYGESLKAYRSRIYRLHLERIRENQNQNPRVKPYEFDKWIEIFGPEVDANWNTNRDKKTKESTERSKEKKRKDQWYFSSTFLYFLFVTVVFSPAVPVLFWLRGPRTARRMGVVFYKSALTVVIFGGLMAFGNWSEKNKANQDKTSKETSMPNLIGMNYGEFVDNNSEFNEKYFPDTIDLIESRSVWDNYNWMVVAQIPPAGSKVNLEDRPCLGIVKTDELELDRQKLRCWREINGFEDLEGYKYNMLSKDLISITLTDLDLNGYFLKSKVWIEMKDWNSVMLTYCSYEPIGANGSTDINLKLDAGASGTVFGDGGESFDAGLFNDWNGEYTYRVEKIEKSFGSGCFSY